MFKRTLLDYKQKVNFRRFVYIFCFILYTVMQKPIIFFVNVSKFLVSNIYFWSVFMYGRPLIPGLRLLLLVGFVQACQAIPKPD